MSPINVAVLESYLRCANYDQSDTEFLINGFHNGFSIGYQGPLIRSSQAKNIPFTPGVSSHTEMWNKIMMEIKQGHAAPPFSEIPYENYIQSPTGLVPKKGNKTRLIFHLSYNFSEAEHDHSMNYFTKKEICLTTYNDLDHAVANCLANSGDSRHPPVLAKTDLTSAFRMLPIRRDHWKWLVFKARDLETGEFRYFIDKCLPFGASISFSHYQRFSKCSQTHC